MPSRLERHRGRKEQTFEGQAAALSLTDVRNIHIEIAELSGAVEFVDRDCVGDIGHTVSRVPLLKNTSPGTSVIRRNVPSHEVLPPY